jgi:HEPN domain-containing protein
MDKQNDEQKEDLTIEQKNKVELYESWLNEARKDLVRAERNVPFSDWDEVVFHSQQALEKLGKAIFILLIDRFIPFTHKIHELVKLVENKLTEPIDEDRYSFFSNLSQYYIIGRYLNQSGSNDYELNDKISNNLLIKTKETFEWLLRSLPKMDSMECEPSKPSK